MKGFRFDGIPFILKRKKKMKNGAPMRFLKSQDLNTRRMKDCLKIYTEKTEWNPDDKVTMAPIMQYMSDDSVSSVRVKRAAGRSWIVEGTTDCGQVMFSISVKDRSYQYISIFVHFLMEMMRNNSYICVEDAERKTDRIYGKVPVNGKDNDGNDAFATVDGFDSCRQILWHIENIEGKRYVVCPDGTRIEMENEEKAFDGLVKNLSRLIPVEHLVILLGDGR